LLEFLQDLRSHALPSNGLDPPFGDLSGPPLQLVRPRSSDIILGFFEAGKYLLGYPSTLVARKA